MNKVKFPVSALIILFLFVLGFIACGIIMDIHIHWVEIGNNWSKVTN